MIHYNLDFLYASLCLQVIVLLHHMLQQRRQMTTDPMFGVILVCGFFDVTLDILTSLLIEMRLPGSAFLTSFSLTAFFFFQSLMPMIFIIYTQGFRNAKRKSKLRFMVTCSVPCIILMLLILTNPLHHQFFAVTLSCEYIHGPLYMLMYYYAAIYILIPPIHASINHREFENRDIATIWIYMLLTISCVIIQSFVPTLMLTGFGIGIGICYMYMTMSNPARVMDYLTGTYQQQLLRPYLGRLNKQHSPVYMITVDFIHMQRINALYGVSFGNEILKETAASIKESADTDCVFRIGGKQFIAVVDREDLYRRCLDKLYSTFTSPITFNNETLHITAIISGITSPDIALNYDKAIAYCSHLTSINRQAHDTILIEDHTESEKDFLYTQEIEKYLQIAMDKDLFELNFQPVYSLTDMKYTSCEVLSRLRHPELGMIRPDLFIRIAETNGDIDRITSLQFNRLCQFLKSNPGLMKEIDHVKFNLSPHELIAHQFARTLVEIIDRYELPYSWFQFEITETAATEYAESLSPAVSYFTEKGIAICMDDFGSGYANLNAVMNLPFKTIKLDRSLLQNICDDIQTANFYHSMIQAFHSMGYSIVAEGVETEEEYQLLKTWGIDMIQGYYFSRPLSSSDLLKNILGQI